MLRGVECGESPDPVPPPEQLARVGSRSAAPYIYTCPAMPVASPGDRSAMHEISPIRPQDHPPLQARQPVLPGALPRTGEWRPGGIRHRRGQPVGVLEHPDCQHHDPSARNGNLHHPGRHEGTRQGRRDGGFLRRRRDATLQRQRSSTSTSLGSRRKASTDLPSTCSRGYASGSTTHCDSARPKPSSRRG